MTIYNQIDSNKRKTWVVMVLFVLLITFLGFVFGKISGYGNSMVAFAVVISSVTSFFSYFFSDSIALSISGAIKVDKNTEPKVFRIVENLCIGAGIPAPKVYLIKDTAINAFAVGRDPKHAAVVFTTGAVERLEDEELEGIAAHELSHIKNFDTRLMVIVVVLVGTVTLLADFMARSMFYRKRSKDDSNIGNVLILVGLLLVALSPVIASLIQLAISRNREYLADASGALLTRYPVGLAGALEKIAEDKEPLEVANKATAHLYISNPLKNQKGSVSWFANMFNTHPPINNRIQRLRSM